MIELVKSGVLFNQEQHTYSLDGKQLQGITSTLLHKLNPNKYDGIPARVLQRAADNGTLIHEKVELSDTIGVWFDEPEVQAYIALKKDMALTTIRNEYIVTDRKEFATPIDIVLQDEDENIILAEVKTWRKNDEEYVSWQLSIGARFFEQQNKGLKVSRLAEFWLRDGKAAYIDIPRKRDEELDELFNAYHNGTPFKPEDKQVALIAPDAVRLLIEATAAYEEAKKAKEEVTAALLRAMEEHHVKSWDTDLLRAAYTPPTESTTFDTKRFQQEHPDLYAQYTKTAMRKATVRVTIR